MVHQRQSTFSLHATNATADSQKPVSLDILRKKFVVSAKSELFQIDKTRPQWAGFFIFHAKSAIKLQAIIFFATLGCRNWHLVLTIKGGETIARRPNLAPPSRDTGPRVNLDIRAPRVRVIDHEGQNLGVMAPRDAVTAAEEVGLDLVEVSPNVEPPVCKILDYGKYKYETQKKAAEARRNQKTVDLKEVKFRPNIDTHDYEVKLRNARRFLDDGDKLKVTLRFRGREMAHQELGRELLQRVSTDLEDIGKVESMPKLENRQMIMVVGPKI